MSNWHDMAMRGQHLGSFWTLPSILLTAGGNKIGCFMHLRRADAESFWPVGEFRLGMHPRLDFDAPVVKEWTHRIETSATSRKVLDRRSMAPCDTADFGEGE